MAVLIDGRQAAASIRAEIKQEVEKIGGGSSGKVGLAVIMVGNFPASQVYVSLKEKACSEVGIISVQHNLPDDASIDNLLNLIDELNADDSVNGILLQLPLPGGLDANEALDRIDPQKDVDGFHPLNVGLLWQNLATLMPCTPAGCLELLDRYKIPIEGANAVVVGRSNIVGKPVAAMLLHRNATVTICHSRTKDLGAITSRADILVAAVGRPNTITKEMVKKGAAVIDVGMNRLDGKLMGDVDFNGVVDKVGFITPAPGGVGPMTIAMLLTNTLLAYKLQRNLIVSLQDDSGRKRK